MAALCQPACALTLDSRQRTFCKHVQNTSLHVGSGAAGVSAQSPIAAQVLAGATGGQGMRRKSRLQHVTAAEVEASPGLPQQANPGSAGTPRAASLEGPGQTPQGGGAGMQGEGRTPRTGLGPVYMTPPTGSAQRPAVRFLLCA